VDETGRPELSFGRAFSPLNEARQKLIVRLDARGASLARQYVDRVTRRPGFPDWVSGACLLVWRRDAERAGLLDERYFMYSEDVDFCAALRARGRKVLFTPAAEVVHLRGRSRASAPTATAAAYRRSQVAYYEKHRPWWSPWLRRYLAWRGQWPPPPGPP
jgi:GT2 family glycosyltransferase